MTVEYKIELKSDKRGQGYAKIYSSLLKDEFQRKRSYACLSALYAFLNFVEEYPQKFTVQKTMTLFRNPALNEEYELSDIYINGRYIDFRVFVEGDAVLLPKVHEDNGILPDYYAVVKTDKNLTKFELYGFLDTDTMKTEAFDYYYNSVSLSQLISYDKFVSEIEKVSPVTFDASEHNKVAEEYLRLTDNEIDKDTKTELIKHMLQCEDCRREFCCFTGFEMVSINTGKYPELTDDKTLDIVAAQAVEKGEYNGKEEKIYIGDDQNFEELPETEPEEPVNEVVQNDDLNLNIEENTGDYEIIEEEQPEKSNELSSGDNVTGMVAAGAAGVAAGIVAADDDKIGLFEDSDDSEIIESISDDDILDADVNDIIFADDEDTGVNREVEVKDVSSNDDNSLDEVESDSGENAQEFDILDELFSIDETLPENEADNKNVPSSEIKNSDEDLQMILNSDEEESIIDDDIPEETSDVQKVIIDYSDDGKPVYSYVTSISDDDSLVIEDSETDSIDSEEEDNLLLDDLDAENEVLTDFDKDDSEENSDESLLENEDITSEISSEEDLDLSDELLEIDNEEIDKDEQLNSDIDDSEDDFELEQEDDKDFGKDDKETTVFSLDDSSINAGFAESMYDSQVENFVNEDEEEESDDEYIEEEDSDETSEEDDEEYEDDDEEYEDDDEDGEEDDSDDEEDDDAEYEDDDAEYEDDDDDDDDSLDFGDDDADGKRKSNLIGMLAAVLLGILIIGAGTYYFVSHKNNGNIAVNNVQNNVPVQNVSNNDIIPISDSGNDMIQVDNSQMPQENIPQEQPVQNDEYQAPPLTEQDLQQEAPLTNDPNKAIANAFSQNMPIVAFNGMNWQFNTKFFADKSFQEFLRKLDNSLKEKIKTNLMNASEDAPNKAASARILVDNEGQLIRTDITSSSGSAQIDNIVLQSIKDSFDGQKTVVIPDGDLKSDNYNLVVVIKF